MKAIFLDRDGVINRKAPEGEYITRWSEVGFLPGAVEAIGTLHRNGFKIIIVANQRGVATANSKLPTTDSLADAIRAFAASEQHLSPKAIAHGAARFSNERFKQEMADFVAARIEEFRGGSQRRFEPVLRSFYVGGPGRLSV